MDTDTNDIASGLSNCITRDGQSPPTAAIPMGAQKITGLANGVAAQDATTVLQVFTAPTFVGPVTVSSGGVAITGNSTLVGTLGSLTGLSSSGTVSFTTGTTTVATAAPGDNSTNAASTAFVATSYAPLASPALTGVPTAPSAAAGTNTTQIATTAYVQTTAFSSALPNQAGNAGKFVTTDGSTASWGTVTPPAYINFRTYFLGQL